MANPDYELFVERNPEMALKFRDFVKHALTPGALPSAMKELIAVTLLASTGYMRGVESHAKRALDAGATPEELREALAMLLPFAGVGRFLEAYPVVERVLDGRAG